MFKVGDIVKARKSAESVYCITVDSHGFRGRVVKIKHHEITVEIIEHFNTEMIGYTIPVHMRYFELVGEKEDMGEKTLDKAIESTGLEILTIAMEECAELIQAISKLKRGKPNKDNLAEEIADVLICIDAVKKIGEISNKEIAKWRDFKEQRMLDRIKNDNFK